MGGEIYMTHYHWQQDGMIVVQNAVMGNLGQKHEHTPEDFRAWIKSNSIDPEHLVDLDKD